MDEFDQALAGVMKCNGYERQVESLKGTFNGECIDSVATALDIYTIRWLKFTNIGILCMPTMDKNVDGCKIRIDLKLEKFPNAHGQDCSPNDVYIFSSSSLDEYEIVLNTPELEGANLKKLLLPISSTKKGPREKALYMENGFSKFLDFFCCFTIP